MQIVKAGVVRRGESGAHDLGLEGGPLRVRTRARRLSRRGHPTRAGIDHLALEQRAQAVPGSRTSHLQRL